jgi:hypothetical protein
MKTLRLLKREQPDRAKVEELFASKSGDVLLAALANPEHSEEARKILQELADAHGLQSEDERGWAQTEESMHVAPFGRKPTFDEALSAATRRRRLYRALQLVLLVGVVSIPFTFMWDASVYEQWVQDGIDAGQADPGLVEGFREPEARLGFEDIYKYLHGRDLFAAEVRSLHIDKLIEAEVLDSPAVRGLFTEGWTTLDLVRDMNTNLDTTLFDAIKLDALNSTLSEYEQRANTGAAAGFLEEPPDHEYVAALVSNYNKELEHWRTST